jgi:hypothetical protein
MYNRTSIPAAVQVVEITMMLGFLKCIFEVILDFRDLLQ